MASRIDIRRVFEAPAPCDDCLQRYICEEQELACRAFSGYVVNGKIYDHTNRQPTHNLFNRIFKDDDPKALTNYLKSIDAKQGKLSL
jgi:hypothetical protein